MTAVAVSHRLQELALSVDEVLPNPLFEKVRPRLRPLVAEIRRRRRQRLEPHCTIAFENRETVLWQVQEVLRVEGRTQPRQVAEEVARYDALLPRPGELRATVLVDGGPARDADRFCERLASDPCALALRIGAISCFAKCVDERPSLSSPVRYMCFSVEGAGVRALELANRPLELVVRDSSCSPVRLPDELRQALATDLRITSRGA